MGLGFRVEDLGFRVSCRGLWLVGSCRVSWGCDGAVLGLNIRVLGVGLGVSVALTAGFGVRNAQQQEPLEMMWISSQLLGHAKLQGVCMELSPLNPANPPNPTP